MDREQVAEIRTLVDFIEECDRADPVRVTMELREVSPALGIKLGKIGLQAVRDQAVKELIEIIGGKLPPFAPVESSGEPGSLSDPESHWYLDRLVMGDPD